MWQIFGVSSTCLPSLFVFLFVCDSCLAHCVGCVTVVRCLPFVASHVACALSFSNAGLFALPVCLVLLFRRVVFRCCLVFALCLLFVCVACLVLHLSCCVGPCCGSSRCLCFFFCPLFACCCPSVALLFHVVCFFDVGFVLFCLLLCAFCFAIDVVFVSYFCFCVCLSLFLGSLLSVF